MSIAKTIARDLIRMTELRHFLDGAVDVPEEDFREFREVQARLVKSLLPVVQQAVDAGLFSISLYTEDGDVRKFVRAKYRYVGFECDRAIVNGNIHLCASESFSLMLSAEDENSFAPVLAAIENFRNVQNRFSEAGAADSEADVMFQALVHDAYSGLSVTVLPDPSRWSLYTKQVAPKDGEPAYDANAIEAGQALAKATKEAVLAILAVRKRDRLALGELLRPILWRFFGAPVNEIE